MVTCRHRQQTGPTENNSRSMFVLCVTFDDGSILVNDWLINQYFVSSLNDGCRSSADRAWLQVANLTKQRSYDGGIRC